MVECADGSIYTGITTNLDRRIHQHNTGKGAKYTKTRRPVCLRAFWYHPDRSTASKEEARIKKLSRKDKLLLITQ
jgi:putative endonuclease